jgi:restriction system protein
LFQYDESIDGIEYEHYCADILRKSGWIASVSKASNDQGVDIIASNQRLSVAIQCKKYSNPVGNKAVQEVTSGATFHNAEYSVVVSNSTYTTSARQLAAKSGVLLLHHSELGRLEEMLDRQ